MATDEHGSGMVTTGAFADSGVSVTSHGARGDGVTDDTAALQAAVDEAALRGVPVLLPRAARYRITSTLVLPSGTTIEAVPGAVLDVSGVPAEVPAVSATGRWESPVALSADATEGSTTVEVRDGSGICPGDRLKLSRATGFGFTQQPRGEIVTVVSVDGGVLTVEDPLNDSYPADDDGYVEKMDPVERITLRGIHLEGPGDDPTKDVVGFALVACVGVTLQDVSTRYCHTGGVYLTDCVGVSIYGCRFTESLRDGYGYGVAILWGSQDVTVAATTGEKTRHLVTIGGGYEIRGVCRRIAVTGCTASSCDEAGFDCHPAAEFVSFIGCHVNGSSQDGFVMQAGRFTISGCTVEQAGRHGILVSALTIRGYEGTVNGNIVHGATKMGILLDGGGDPAWRTWSGLTIANNTVSDSGYGIYLSNGKPELVSGLAVTGNTVRRCTASHGIYLRGADGPVVQGNNVFQPGPRGEGVYLFGAPDAVVSGNVVDGTGAEARAVRLLQSPGGTVVGNRLRGASTGLHADAASAPVLYVGNVNTCLVKTVVAGEGNVTSFDDGALNI